MLGNRAGRRSILLGACLVVLAGAGVARADVPVPAPATVPAEALLDAPGREAPVPVEFDGQRLFYLRVRIGDRSVAERARSAEQRIEEVADAAEPPGPLKIVEGFASDVFLGDRFVVSVTEGDVGSREERGLYARAIGRRVLEAVLRYRADRRPEVLVRSAGIALALTVALVAALAGLRAFRRRLGPHLAAFGASVLSRLHVQRLELIDARARERFVSALGWTVSTLAVLLLLVAWAEGVAALFPWTRGPALRALHFTLGAAWSVLGGVVGFLPNLVYIALFLAVGWAIHGLNRIFFRAVQAGAIQIPGFYPEWSRTTALLVSGFIFALVAVAIYPYLPGSGSTAFQAIGILAGAMISLGSGSAVANAVSGVVLTYMRPFRIGDFVRIADATGTVIEQSTLVVRLLTIRNEHVTLPASTVLSSPILNYSALARTSGVAIRTSVTIGYDTPWRKVHELLLAAASRTPGVRKDPAPWVVQAALQDFYVHYELDAYVDDPARQHFVLSDLNQAVQDAFFAAGVEILSPHYAQLRDGSRPAIPPEHAPAGPGPAFPVELRGK
jgi:small-conductance mechanosensitive channel